MQTGREINWELVGLAVLSALVLVLNTLRLSSLVSWTMILVYFYIALLYFRSVGDGIELVDLFLWLLVFLSLLHVIINSYFAQASVSFSYLKKWILFSITMICFRTMSRRKCNQKTTDRIILICLLVSVFLIVYFYTHRTGVYLFHNRRTRYLYFYFTSPNLAAMFFSALIMLIMMGIRAERHWSWNAACLAVAAHLLYFILQTHARNCLLSVFLYFLAVLFLLMRRVRRLHISRVVSVILSVVPLLGMWLYFFFLRGNYAGFAQRILESEGKGLDSRVDIWQFALREIRNSPWIGAYAQISDGLGYSQMHNTHLDVFASYGFSVLVLFCVLLVMLIYHRGCDYCGRTSIMSILGFITMLLMGIGEAALVSGGLTLCGFAGLFLALANHEEEQIRNHETSVSGLF